MHIAGKILHICLALFSFYHIYILTLGAILFDIARELNSEGLKKKGILMINDVNEQQYRLILTLFTAICLSANKMTFTDCIGQCLSVLTT